MRRALGAGATRGTPRAGASADAPAQGDRGITLVEMLVVLAVMAVLSAQSVASFGTLRERADDRSTQSNLRNGLAAARIYYNIDLAYTADPAEMRLVEPGLNWQNVAPVTGDPSTEIFVTTEDADQTLVLAARSAGGKCFWLRDAPDSLGYYAAFEVGGACPQPPTAAYLQAWD